MSNENRFNMSQKNRRQFRVNKKGGKNNVLYVLFVTLTLTLYGCASLLHVNVFYKHLYWYKTSLTFNCRS